MNLLEQAWLPVRRADGTPDWIAPHQLTEAHNPPVVLGAVRPDFNGALIQFLIGLVQTAWIKSGEDWSRGQMLLEPPAPEVLREMFAPLREAFELAGEGSRFMQDFTLGPDDKPAENDVGALLIEAPGEKALKQNTDHFVKRGGVGALCPCCVAAAVFTLQVNAPSGGAGHRTSLRGSGPLTTLVVSNAVQQEAPRRDLWRMIACNVLPEDAFNAHGNVDHDELYRIFPWLKAQSATQKDGGETQPDSVHPLQRYWAMPRRIRLDFARTTSGICDVCARSSDQLVSHYFTKNYGLNYKGPWRHPLSPYYRAKATDPYLPMHPQPGGLGYRYWLGWVLGSAQQGKQVAQAQVVEEFLRHDTGGSQFRLWAFGFDLDNMKARCWYESTFPLFDLPDGDEAVDALSAQLEQLLSAATTACDALRYAIRNAWADDGDFTFVDASFWSQTEAGFFETVRHAAELARVHGRDVLPYTEALRREWAGQLSDAARRLFNEIAASGDMVAGNPQRLGAAWRQLCNALGYSHMNPGRKLLQQLGIAPPDDGKNPKKGGKTRSRKTSAVITAGGAT